MRHKVFLAVVAVALLALTVPTHAATVSGPNVTRLRLEISGTSEWQSLKIVDQWVADYVVESVTAGAEITRGHDTISLQRTAGSVSAVVNMIVETNPTKTSFTLQLAKARFGTARAKLYRTNATPALIADISNNLTVGVTTISKGTTRAELVGEGLTILPVDARRKVMAFYYPWFHEGSFDKGRWYDTPTGPWITNDAVQVAAQVDQAIGAGIDTFLVSWDDVGDHPARFDLVMSAAATRPFSVAPVMELLAFENETGFDTAAIAASIRKALQRATQPAFLSVAGKPVVFVFGIYRLGSDGWSAVVNDLAASGLDPFFVAEAGWPGVDGAYLYNPNGYDPPDLRWKYGAYARTLRYRAQLDASVPQRLWAATVSPGQNFSYFSPLFPQNQQRNNGDRYRMTWGAAVGSRPEWVLVTSWNEWYEATHVAPSEKFGTTALGITNDWSAYFRNPTAPSAPDEDASGGLLPALPLSYPLKR